MKSVLNIHWKEWCWSSNTLATWCEKLSHWKRPCCWERLKAGREGDNRRWDGWRVSPTRWTWVWASYRSWWRTGKPGVLQSIGWQRIRHNWTTELNWIETLKMWFNYNEAVKVGPNPIWWCLYMKSNFGHTKGLRWFKCTTELPKCRYSNKTAIYKLNREASEATTPTNTLIFDFRLSELWENKFLLFKSLSLWFWVTWVLPK